MHPHIHTQRHQTLSHVQRRTIPNIVRIRLERRPQHRHRRPHDVLTQHVTHELHHPRTTTHVRRIHRPQELHRLRQAELLTTRHERTNVLRQAPPTEPDTRTQELAPDALVMPDRIRERDDITAARLTHLSHRIDERDLRREERIRAHLDQLSRREIRHQPRRTRRQRPRIHLIQTRDIRLRELPLHAVHEPIRRQRVLHRESLTQELRIPDQTRIHPVTHAGLQHLQHARHRPHRHRRLTHRHRPRLHVRRQRRERTEHIIRVRRILPRLLRRPHTHEMHISIRHISDVRRPPQPTRRLRTRQQLRQPRLEDRTTPRRQRLDLQHIRVDTHHVMTQLSHARRMHRAQIARADDRDLQTHAADSRVPPLLRRSFAARGPRHRVVVRRAFTRRRAYALVGALRHLGYDG